jgi:hypothetical protein
MGGFFHKMVLSLLTNAKMQMSKYLYIVRRGVQKKANKSKRRVYQQKSDNQLKKGNHNGENQKISEEVRLPHRL